MAGLLFFQHIVPPKIVGSLIYWCILQLRIIYYFHKGTMSSACSSGEEKEVDCGPSGRLCRSESIDGDIESLAFSICNIDSNPGLSWAEIEECEVSISSHHRIL